MTRGFKSRIGAVTLMPALVVGAAWSAGCDRQISDRSLVLVDPHEARQLVGDRKGLLGLGDSKGAWIDPRGEKAYREGHIPGAINMPLQHVTAEHARLKGYDILVVYGNDFRDPIAEAMSKRLMELKFGDVRTLRGGTRAWTEAGLELETGDKGEEAPGP